MRALSLHVSWRERELDNLGVFANWGRFCLAVDKQKMLLSEDVGHFSLVRALHLADLITLMNGMVSLYSSTRGLSVCANGGFVV